ncbi:MAG: hypothetical protein F6J98_02425 [Moorea sp. SIO4G2]|nr:hypothetical protein [Moorena sp. SIO4G2]
MRFYIPKTPEELFEYLEKEGLLDRILMSPYLQYGDANNPYLGAIYLPETNRPNEITEVIVKTISPIAKDADMYSPVPMSPHGTSEKIMNISLAVSDIGMKMLARDIDTMTQLLTGERGVTGTLAIRQALNFVAMVKEGHAKNNETKRWYLFNTGTVPIVGLDGYRYDVKYPVDSSYYQIVNVKNGGSGKLSDSGDKLRGWFNPSYDIIDDIRGMKDSLKDSGFNLESIICDRWTWNLIQKHPLISERTNSVMFVDAQGQIRSYAQRASIAAVNQYFIDNDLPTLTVNESMYTEDNGVKREFMRPPLIHPKRHYMVFIGKVMVPVAPWIDPDTLPIDDPNLLGYFAIGTLTGEASPGLSTKTRFHKMKPIAWEIQSSQVGLPVLKVDEAIRVLVINEQARNDAELALLNGGLPANGLLGDEET